MKTADRITPSRILPTIVILSPMDDSLSVYLHHDSILTLYLLKSEKDAKIVHCRRCPHKQLKQKNVMFPRYNISYPVLRLPIRSRYPDFFRNAISRSIVPSDNPVFSHILSLLRLLSSANICKISSCLSVNFIGPFIESG